MSILFRSSLKARPADNCFGSVRTYMYVVDFREGIIIGNFLWRVCADYPIPFSLVLFLFSNPNERTCLVCITISIYWNTDISDTSFCSFGIFVVTVQKTGFIFTVV